jgi:pilus assembly protein Flp/PilA
MQNFLSRFMRDESGATAIEYCLIAAGIGLVIVTGINAFAGALNTSLNASATGVGQYNPASGGTTGGTSP